MSAIVSKSPTDYTKLHHEGAGTTTYITCSNEAAEYAYRYYATPYSADWRAASAGFDAGRKSAEASIDHWRRQTEALLTEATGIPTKDAGVDDEKEPDPEYLKEGDPGLRWVGYGTPREIAEWATLAEGEPPADSLRVHTQCKRCCGTDGEHESYCPDSQCEVCLRYNGQHTKECAVGRR